MVPRPGFRGTSYCTKHADMSDPNAKHRDVRKNLSESAHILLKRPTGQERKRKLATSAKGGKPLRVKKKNIKRDTFPKLLYSRRRHGSGSIVG